MACADFESLDI